ncbi:hypothetical protein ACFLXT_04050, partial [Chloroflexota bacterium]
MAYALTIWASFYCYHYDLYRTIMQISSGDGNTFLAGAVALIVALKSARIYWKSEQMILRQKLLLIGGIYLII